MKLRIARKGVEFIRHRISHYRSSSWREILWALVPALLFWGLYLTLPHYGYIYTWTGSLPVGVWRFNNAGLQSPYIVFCLPANTYSSFYRQHVMPGDDTTSYPCPNNVHYLMKPVVARPGDKVVLTSASVQVNGVALPESATRKKSSRKGMDVPHIPRGHYVVQPGTVWVFSTYNSSSFDSRYYGPVSEGWIRSGVEPVLVYTDNPGYKIVTSGSVHCFWRLCWITRPAGAV